MNTLTLEDLADISLDRQRAQEARNQLTHEENLTALSCSAIFEAREAADDFVNLAYEIEALLRDKDVATNKEQWVMNTRSTIAKCQGRLRLFHLRPGLDDIESQTTKRGIADLVDVGIYLALCQRRLAPLTNKVKHV